MFIHYLYFCSSIPMAQNVEQLEVYVRRHLLILCYLKICRLEDSVRRKVKWSHIGCVNLTLQ